MLPYRVQQPRNTLADQENPPAKAGPSQQHFSPLTTRGDCPILFVQPKPDSRPDSPDYDYEEDIYNEQDPECS